MNSLLYWIRKAGASMFFAGFFPFASGTVGSALTIGMIYFVHSRHPEFFSITYITWQWLFLVCAVGISIFLSNDAKRIFGKDDPSPVIIDEWAGQLITFFLIPISIPTLILGFVLFRFFDIIKPFPAHTMEELDGGAGITFDDVIAGVYANISLLAMLYSYRAIKGLIVGT